MEEEEDDIFSAAASELIAQLASASRGSSTPKHAIPPTSPARRLRSYTRNVEIRGLPETATVETIFDVVASFTPVDDITIFQADGGLGAEVT